MSGPLGVFVSDTGRQHQGRAMAACCDCAFALFGTVWCCVDCVVLWCCVDCVVLCGLCGAVWTVWYCVVQLCVLRTVQHARALAGPVSSLDGTTTFLVRA